MPTAAEVQATIAAMQADGAKLHTVVNGAPGETVTTDAGVVKTLSGLQAEFELDAGTVVADAVAARDAAVGSASGAAGSAASAAASAASAAAAAAGLATQRAERLIAAVKAAARNPASVKLLITKDGAKTYRAGAPTEIETLAPLIGPGTLVQPAFTWDGTGGAGGAALRPIETATGIRFDSQTGFDLASGVLSQTGNYQIDLLFETPALTTTAAAPAGTYASVALMNADIANLKMGDIVKVTGGPVTTLTPDIPAAYVGSVECDDTQLARGLYIKGNGTMGRMDGAVLLSFVNTATNPGSGFARFYLDRRGQISLYSYDGAAQIQCRTLSQDVFTAGQARTQHIKLEVDTEDRHARLWWNGVEVCPNIFITNFAPNRLYINGSPGGNAVVPFSGMRWTMNALCVTESLDFTERRRVSDALARSFGTPEQAWSQFVNVIAEVGQSRGAGSTDAAGYPNTPDVFSGFNGEIVKSVSNSSEAYYPSQVPLKRVYSQRNPGNPWDNGPCAVKPNTFGNTNIVGTYTSSGNAVETIEWGLFAQLFKYEEARQTDWQIIGLNNGGWSLGQLDAKSVPNIYIYGLRAATINATAARDLINRQVSEAVAFWRRRGQTCRLVMVYHEQGETTSVLPIDPTTGNPFIAGTQYGAAYEYSARTWINNELLKLMPPSDGLQPIYIKKAINFSGDGVSNTYNNAPYYYDDQLRRLEQNRDTAFRYAFLGESYAVGGRFIHWPVMNYRCLGERLGWHAGRMIFGGDEGRCFQALSASIVAGKIRLFLSEAAAVVDAAANSKPTVLYRLTTGGVDTFGLVFEPVSGGRTITAVDNTHIADATPYIEVTISGGGAIAGDRINITGTNARWSNYRRATRVFGDYMDQDWTVANDQNGVSGGPGAKKFTVSANVYEITPWLAAGSYVL